MVFQVPPSKASTGENMFEFELEGKSFKVRKYDCLSIAEQVFLRSDECGEEKSLDLIWGAKTTPMGKAVRALEATQFEALQDAWQKSSGVTPGESPASSS